MILKQCAPPKCRNAIVKLAIAIIATLFIGCIIGGCAKREPVLVGKRVICSICKRVIADQTKVIYVPKEDVSKHKVTTVWAICAQCAAKQPMEQVIVSQPAQPSTIAPSFMPTTPPQPPTPVVGSAITPPSPQQPDVVNKSNAKLPARVSSAANKKRHISKERVRQRLQIISAYFDADPDLRSKVVKLLHKLRRKYRPPGVLHIFIKNNGDKRCTLTKVRWNGVSIEDAINRRQIIWLRIHPNPIPAKRVAELTIRFRNAPGRENKLEVESDAGDKATAKVLAEPTPLRVGWVCFNERLNRVFIFVERRQPFMQHLVKVYLNGNDVTKKCKVYTPWLEDGFGIVTLNAKRRLTLHDTVAIGISTQMRTRVETLTHVAKPFFPIAVIGDITPRALSEYRTMGINTVITLREPTLAQLNGAFLNGLRITAPFESGRQLIKLRAHPSLLAYLLTQYPDINDAALIAKERNQQALGQSASIVLESATRYHRLDPWRPSVLMLSASLAPSAWFTYAQIADWVLVELASFPPRHLNAMEQPLNWLCQVTPPRRLMLLVPLSRVAKGGRFPAPDEVRIMTLYSIGSGAKGICFDFYEGKHMRGMQREGWRNQPALRMEVTRLARELYCLMPWLVCSHPVPIIARAPKGAWARTLLCSTDAIALVAVNRNYPATLSDLKFTLRLPQWFTLYECFAFNWQGVAQVRSKLNGRYLTIWLPRLRTGQVIMLANNPKLRFMVEQRRLHIRKKQPQHPIQLMMKFNEINPSIGKADGSLKLLRYTNLCPNQIC